MSKPSTTLETTTEAVSALYRQLLAGWNAHDAVALAALQLTDRLRQALAAQWT